MDPEIVAGLRAELRLPSALCELVALRGHVASQDAREFLRPRLERLHDPRGLADAGRAAERIAHAIVRGERILVHGDYDVDGMCGTALVTRWIRGLGGLVTPFVPARSDGYDLGPAGLAAARGCGAALVVTIDCGTKAHEVLARAKAAGIDTVVTDHHTASELPSPAIATVNPKRSDCSYPDQGLSGTGVAYKLCQLVAEELGRGASRLVEYLDLVALATVADLVPLTGENRVLTHYGLRRFGSSTVPGIDALLQVADLDPAAVNAGHLGFQIGPRLNAAGRIGDSMDGVRLLLTEDRERAAALAVRLDQLNRERKLEVERIEDEVLGILERDHDSTTELGVVVAGEGWPSGVIGLVASRIAERLHRPVVVVALDGEKGRGSARSIPGFDLYECVAALRGHLIRFGGHRAAAGLDISREELGPFRSAFAARVAESLPDSLLRPSVNLDLELDLADADENMVRWLRYLGPHGVGNPGPLFCVREAELAGAHAVGGGAHLRGRLVKKGRSLAAIGFRMAADHPPPTLRGRFDIAFRLSINEWRGRRTVQAEIKAIREAAALRRE